MLQKYISSKQKTLKRIIIQADTLSIGSILKVFTISNMKIFFFLVDFNTIDTNNILDIHKYLIKK